MNKQLQDRDLSLPGELSKKNFLVAIIIPRHRVPTVRPCPHHLSGAWRASGLYTGRPDPRCVYKSPVRACPVSCLPAVAARGRAQRADFCLSQYADRFPPLRAAHCTDGAHALAPPPRAPQLGIARPARPPSAVSVSAPRASTHTTTIAAALSPCHRGFFDCVSLLDFSL